MNGPDYLSDPTPGQDADAAPRTTPRRPGRPPWDAPDWIDDRAQVTAHLTAHALGGRVATEPPPPDSMLAWLLAQPSGTTPDIGAEWKRRGFDPITEVTFYSKETGWIHKQIPPE